MNEKFVEKKDLENLVKKFYREYEHKIDYYRMMIDEYEDAFITVIHILFGFIILVANVMVYFVIIGYEGISNNIFFIIEFIIGVNLLILPVYAVLIIYLKFDRLRSNKLSTFEWLIKRLKPVVYKTNYRIKIFYWSKLNSVDVKYIKGDYDHPGSYNIILYFSNHKKQVNINYKFQSRESADLVKDFIVFLKDINTKCPKRKGCDK